MESNWFKEFLDLYFSGEYEKAYHLKYINIPLSLYKYQPFEEERISTVINNKLWFTLPKDMNDPFDSRGVYLDYQNIEEFLEKILSKEKIKSNTSIDDVVNGFISSARDNIRISCFSEELYSMPMWAHYANNHTGYCIEYNFTNLKDDNVLVRDLFPISYETNRYNITNLFKMIFNEKFDMRIKLLFFLMNLKHSSWSYEKEWRIINTNGLSQSPFIGGLVNCPINPEAIYLGLNFDKSKIDYIKSKFTNKNIPIYILKASNSEFFNLELQEI